MDDIGAIYRSWLLLSKTPIITPPPPPKKLTVQQGDVFEDTAFMSRFEIVKF
jgi:hypothetical protein